MAIGEDGTIYKTGYTQGCYSNFTAINPDGGLKWTEETDCFDHGFEDIVIGADGTIYVGIRMTNILPCEMGAEEIRSVNLVAYNQDGTVKWESGAGGGSPAIGADGIIYTSAVRFLPNEGDFKIVYSIDAVNPDGTQKWAYEIDHVDFDSDNCPDYWLIIYNFAIGVDGTLYVSSQHEDGNYKNLYAINTSSLGLANSSWPMFMHDERHTGRSDMQIINDFLTFDPDPSTYLFTPDTTDCQAGAVGKFSFEAKLTNISEKELSYLHVEVNELTNDNLLLTDNGLIGGGERFEVSKIDDYADGYLSAGEYVDVPFTVCLKNTKPFRFFVNVVGVAED